MKRLIFLLTTAFLLIFASFESEAQIRWPFGAVNSVTGGTNDTVDISSQLIRGLNYYDVSNDTTMLINVVTVDDSWSKGDFLVIELTEGSTSADTLRYGTNITGLESIVASGKTKVITFIFNGTAWIKQSEVQID